MNLRVRKSWAVRNLTRIIPFQPQALDAHQRIIGLSARAITNSHTEPFGTAIHLAPATAAAVGEGRPAAQFMHGFNLGGTAAITRANDPFWNMRAFDNALSRHDGYRLSTFICAMNQLVMDDITSWDEILPNKIAEPAKAQTTALPNKAAVTPTADSNIRD
jgi:hypothetical protein